MAKGAFGFIVSLQTETERGLVVTQATDESQANAREDPFSKVNELITDSSDANHKSNRDDELAKASEKKVDLETQVATHSCKLGSTCSEGQRSVSSTEDGGDACR